MQESPQNSNIRLQKIQGRIESIKNSYPIAASPITASPIGYNENPLINPNDLGLIVGMFQNMRQNSTNHIIIEDEAFAHKRRIFMPAYVRMQIVNFIDIDVLKLNAQLLVKIIISICTRQLSKYILQRYGDKQIFDQIIQLVSTNLKIQFSRDQVIQLNNQNTDNNIKYKQDDNEIKFVIRKLINANVAAPDYIVAPFQLIKLEVGMKLLKVKGDISGVNHTIKFNCMDTDNQFIKLSYNPLSITYGQYKVARSKTQVKYSKKEYTQQEDQDPNNDENIQLEVNADQQKQRLKSQENQDNLKKLKKMKKQKLKGQNPEFDSFNYVSFSIPMYKVPVVDLLTVFIPLWTLAVINLFIFFQGNELAKRLAAIGTVLLAVSALTPAIRAQIPSQAEWTIVQMMILLETITTLFSAIQSFMVARSQTTGADRTINALTESSSSAVLFILAVVFTGITVVVICGLFIYFLVKVYQYESIKYPQDQSIFKEDNKQKWANTQCDQEFVKHKESLAEIMRKTDYKIHTLKPKLDPVSQDQKW